jgi:two-component system KDP operon response regulator KdpE
MLARVRRCFVVRPVRVLIRPAGWRWWAGSGHRAARVTIGGARVDLTPREFEVLKVLVAHAGRLVTHGRLLRAVWGSAYSEESHYAHVYVSQIRRKLAAADPTGAARGLIVAEPGVGYRIAEP